MTEFTDPRSAKPPYEDGEGVMRQWAICADCEFAKPCAVIEFEDPRCDSCRSLRGLA